MLNRISNRVWWSAVAMLCSCIIASRGFSQHPEQEQHQVQAAGQRPALPVIPDHIRARSIELVDKSGYARVRLEVDDESRVLISIFRPDESQPVFRLADLPDDIPGAEVKDPKSASSSSRKKWSAGLEFVNHEGKGASLLSIFHSTKNRAWWLTTTSIDDFSSGKGIAKTTNITAGSIEHRKDKVR